MYVLKRQLLSDGLHMKGTSIHMQKETVKAASMKHQQRHIFLVTDTIVLFLHHSNIFMNTFIFLLISTFYLYTKINCHCFGEDNETSFMSVFTLFLYFSSKKKVCVSACRFIKVKKKKGNEIFFYLPKETNPIFFFLKAKQRCIFFFF